MSFEEFVQNMQQSIDNPTNPKRILEAAIRHYNLKSQVKIENDKEILYLTSMAEENMLNRLTQIALADENSSVEHLYEGNVVRRH
jgi:hypothetical protein